MARTHVILTDHILDMKNKINDISYDVGDISLLSTSGDDSDIVQAINSLDSDIGTAESVAGSLEDLLTTANGSLVEAINEVRLLGVDSDSISDLFSATNTGTGFGTLSFDGNGVYNFSKVTNDNIRSAISAGDGIDITSGSISGEDATTDNKGIAKFNTGNFSVTSGDVTIKAGGVDSDHLASNAVTSIKINGSAVTTAKINNSAVTTDKINNTAVTTAKVADDAITYAKLQNLVTANRVLGSTSTGLIGEVQIARAMIVGDAIDGSKIADDAINSEHYVDGSIDPAHLASNAVTEVKIASNAVTSGKIAASSVTQAKIDDDAVNKDKLETVVELIIYNSAGEEVKKLYGAGS